MKIAVYPGSFDPITNGHLDVIDRATHLFDKVIVAVAHNSQKSSLFDKERRAEMIREATGGNDRIEVTHFEGLLVDFAKSQSATALVRGLRAVSDFEFEFQMALMNRNLAPEMETIFLMPKEEYIYISSRIVKEVARYGGEIGSLVPPHVSKALREAFR
jgi:pantetheine-phosphate adenylyltransferase